MTTFYLKITVSEELINESQIEAKHLQKVFRIPELPSIKDGEVFTISLDCQLKEMGMTPAILSKIIVDTFKGKI